MKYLKITNNTGLKIPFDKWLKEVQDDVDRIDKKHYPINVIVSNSEYDEEQEHFEHSKFTPEENKMQIKVIPNSTLRQIKWSFMHEFRHFMQKHIKELNIATHDREDTVELKKLIDKIKPLSDDDFYEAFHDILPMESDACTYATTNSGADFRKHPLKDTIPQYFGDNKEKETMNEI